METSTKPQDRKDKSTPASRIMNSPIPRTREILEAYIADRYIAGNV